MAACGQSLVKNSCFAKVHSHETRAKIYIKGGKRLFCSWHPIEIKSLEIYHGFCNKILLLSLSKEASLIQNSSFYQSIYILRIESLFGEILLILHISFPSLEARILSSLWILISNVHCCRPLLAFGKFSGSGLFLYETGWKAVWICHISLFWREVYKIWPEGKALILRLGMENFRQKFIFKHSRHCLIKADCCSESLAFE